jgi:hypothetical protein
MLDRQVFVSYPHVERQAVQRLVSAIENMGLPVWYSGRMGTGDFAVQIRERIQSCAGMVVILTEDCTRPRFQEWILTEMSLLNDAGMKHRMLPCIIGDFVLPEHYLSAIMTAHQIRADSVDALCGDAEFLNRLEDFGDPESRRPRTASPGREAETPSAWLDRAADPPMLALGLACAILEYSATDVVFAAAAQIEVLIESQLRPLTDEELKERPRAIGQQGRGARLSAVRAERVSLRNPAFDIAFEGVRFASPNWRAELLWQVWSDREDLREILIAWCQQVLAENPPTAKRQRLTLALGLIAQRGYASVNDSLLAPWLASPLRRSHLDTVSEVMAMPLRKRTTRWRSSGSCYAWPGPRAVVRKP